MLCLDVRRYIIYSDVSVADPGERPGGPLPTLFLDQTGTRRAEKNFLGDWDPLRLWLTANVRFKIESVQLKIVQDNCWGGSNYQ